MKNEMIRKMILVPMLVLVLVLATACSGGSGDSSGTATSTGTAESSSEGSAAQGSEKAAANVTYNYVSPSDLSGDESSDDDSSDTDGQDSQDGNGAGEQDGNDGGAQGEPGGPGAGPGGPDTQSFDYNGTYTASKTADGKEEESDGEELESQDKDKNVALAQNGGTLTLTNAKLTKSGSDNDGDGTNFYGVNSSLLAVGEDSVANIFASGIESTSDGSNGIFATDNATVYASDVQITTKDSDNARGLDATYGGVIYADKLNISTAGDHCAAIATDRGGGYISVTNSELATAGSGSPLLYSTGDIEVDSVTGTASGSQIAGMEGMNRIIINNSTLASTNDAISGSDPIKNGVIIYQSTSGDADTSTDEMADFETISSTLKTSISDGAMFYVTNTNAKILLQDTTLDFDSDNVDLLDAVGNSSNNWGSEGSNGGKVDVTCKEQTLAGNIKVDEISSVEFTLAQGSEYTGTIKGDITDDNMEVNVSADSMWVVTEDCTVSELNVEDGAKIVDKDGKTVTIKAGGETKVEGDSDITITVKGDYGNEIDDDAAKTTSVDVLDRAGFDKKYEATTTFGKN